MNKNNTDRLVSYQILTKRLILLSAITLGIIGVIFGLTLYLSEKFYVSWLALMCGILGGFVSIQQRLPNITEKELILLTNSWFQILLIPIYGGVFALVLYVLFLSELISGNMFPSFHFPEVPEGGVNSEYYMSFFRNTFPTDGNELAKLMVWSFIAGFSERYVPQIITSFATKGKDVE